MSYAIHPTNIAMEMCLRPSTWLLWTHGTSCYISECPTATKELRELHFSYLNQDYNKNVYKLWKDAGCYQDVALHLGYRLVLKKVAMFFLFLPACIFCFCINVHPTTTNITPYVICLLNIAYATQIRYMYLVF